MLRSQELAQEFIPVKSVEVIPEVQQDLTPSGLTQLRLVIPSYLGFLNPADTKLQYDLTMTGRGQPHPDPRCGAHALWKNLRIQDGAGGTTLEEISDYNTLVAQTWAYSENDSILAKRALFEGQALNPAKDNDPYWIGAEAWQSAPVTAQKTAATLQIEHPIHSGIFQSDKVWPLVGSGGLRVYADIETVQQALTYANGPDGTDAGTNLQFAYRLSVAKVAGTTDEKTVSISGTSTSIVLAPAGAARGPYASAAPWNNNAWCIGDMLYVADAGTAKVNEEALGIITAFGINATLMQVTYIPNRAIGTFNSANHAIGSALYVKLADRLNGLVVADTNMPALQIAQALVATNYTISNIRLLASIVSPPAKYVAEMVEMAQSAKGLAMDVKTWTLVRSNLSYQQGLTSQMIPTKETRCYSVLSVPLAQEYTGRIERSGLQGVVDVAQDYQYVFGGQLIPDRSISLARYSATIPKSDTLHLMELEKAIINAGVPVRTLQRSPQKFLIARAFSRYGQVADLSQRDLSLRVTYASGSALTKFYNHYISHLRRVVMSSAGVQAM